MAKIVIVGDIHEGKTFDKDKPMVDIPLGVRTYDLHRNFKLVAEYAIKQQASLFVVLGDMLDKTNTSPFVRELIRRDIIRPLGDANIPVWIIAGNHDEVRSLPHETSLEDFRDFPHVKIFRHGISTERIKVGTNTVGIVIAPYIPFNILQRKIEDRIGRRLSTEETAEISKNVLGNLFANSVSELEKDTHYRLLLAHYFIEGARFHRRAYPDISSYPELRFISNEVKINTTMIPKNIDLAVFSHIHYHQQVLDTPPTVYTGSVERMDWGEYLEDKGFIVVDIPEEHDDNISWQFISLPLREMLKLKLVVDDNLSVAPVDYILNQLPTDCKDKLIRLELTASEKTWSRIDNEMYRIDNKLAEALRYDLKRIYIEDAGIPVVYTNYLTDPYKLFEEFIMQRYKNDPDAELLLKYGKEILDSVVEK